MARDSFILYTEQSEILQNLTDEEAGKLIKEIFQYIETGKENEMDRIVKMAFVPIRQNLDRNNEKWEEIKQKRSEAGKIGAEIKKQKQAKQANANFAKSKQANQAVNVNVNVNDNVNDNVISINNNKSNMNNKANINTDKEEEIESCVDRFPEAVKFFEENFGPITPYSLSVLESYDEFTPEMLIYAMQKSVDAKANNINYLKSILNNWSKKGIKTLIEAKEEDKRFHTHEEGPKKESQEEYIARRVREMEALDG